ncbi:YsnF/AvaK domain-containing protein [Microvirga tunisiensis]|nr:YsnF/AvaK domain-containing protein [Microvirga tunisiensis]
MSETDKPDTLVIPIVEEEAKVAKRQVVSDRIIVKTTVNTEERVLKEMLSQETVEVERIPVNRVVDVVPQLRTEGDVTIVPVFEERLVVEKQLFLVEEVRIRRTTSVESVEVPVTLRKELATVERLDGSGEPITE